MIPHFIWIMIWSIGVAIVAVAGWFVVVTTGRLPAGIHGFQSAYVRYVTHFLAFLYLAAEPYPGFKGKPGYTVDVEIDPPVRQRRLGAFFRLVLAIPALLIMTAAAGLPSPTVTLGGSPETGVGDEWSGGDWTFGIGGGIAAFGLLFGWFAALALGRMPRGLRDLVAWGVGYYAQANAYLLLLTPRYPDSRPDLVEPLPELPPHPVRLDLRDELRRNRLTVVFRLLLALPHIVWLLLWTILIALLSPVLWLVTLALGRLPAPLHRFAAAWVRYDAHVVAFVTLVGGPFPGFAGTSGSYPVGIEIDGPARQRRVKTLFRGILVIPALILAGAYGSFAFLALLLGWWYALATRRMPHGLRDIGATALRYSAQTYAYALFLTDRYPYSCPVVTGRREPEPWDPRIPFLPGARHPDLMPGGETG